MASISNYPIYWRDDITTKINAANLNLMSAAIAENIEQLAKHTSSIQQLNTLKEVFGLAKDKSGKTLTNGTVLFGDIASNSGYSGYSGVFGQSNQVGMYGYFITNIEPADTKNCYKITTDSPVSSDYTASSTLQFSVHNFDHYYNRFVIDKVEGNVITVTDTRPEGSIPIKLPTDKIPGTDRTYRDSFDESYAAGGAFVYVVGKNSGSLLKYNKGAFVSGSDNYASGANTALFGWNNKALGNYSFGSGRDNVLGWSCTAFGYRNIILGNSNFGEGDSNTTYGLNSHVEGMSNIIWSNFTHIEGSYNLAKVTANNSHIEGSYNVSANAHTHIEGSNNVIDANSNAGLAAHIEGMRNYVIGNGTSAHVEGQFNTAAENGAHAQGYGAFAGGLGSHAEGRPETISSCKVKGQSEDLLQCTIEKTSVPRVGDLLRANINSKDNIVRILAVNSDGNLHTLTLDRAIDRLAIDSTVSFLKVVRVMAEGGHGEGAGTEVTANALGSHAEGFRTFVEARYAHVEGYAAKIGQYGWYSHAQGYATQANAGIQHVGGMYNIADMPKTTGADNNKGTYVEIIGNGTSSKRSNARTLDWSGNAWYAGTIKIGGTGMGDKNAKEVATQEYVNNKVRIMTSAPDSSVTGNEGDIIIVVS